MTLDQKHSKYCNTIFRESSTPMIASWILDIFVVFFYIVKRYGRLCSRHTSLVPRNVAIISVSVHSLLSSHDLNNSK